MTTWLWLNVEKADSLRGCELTRLAGAVDPGPALEAPAFSRRLADSLKNQDKRIKKVNCHQIAVTIL